MQALGTCQTKYHPYVPMVLLGLELGTHYAFGTPDEIHSKAPSA